MPRKRKSARWGHIWRAIGTSAVSALIGVGLAILVAHRPAPPPPAPRAVLALPPAPPAPRLAVQRPAPVLIPTPAPPAPARAEPPWQRYAAPAEPADGRARVAVVLDDLGLDRVRTERAIELPAPLTLSFMPYATEVRQEADSARERGHEILVHVPMEPLSRANDMGPNGLALGLSHEEVLRRLRWDLDRFAGYVGINNHMGSRFTADPDAMELVIDELKARGLLFLDSRTSGATVGARVAQRAGLPFAERDVFLDDDQSPAMIAARLRDLEAAARHSGSVIAIGHPHDATLAALAAWINTLPTKRLQLVPLTEIVKLRNGALLYADAARTAAR